jgi:Holliday junction resolvasome RuvABC endonuclease subunit
MNFKQLLSTFPDELDVVAGNIIFGIDPSITGPGFSIINTENKHIQFHSLSMKKPTGDYSRHKRFYARVLATLVKYRPRFIYIEGYSFSSTTSAYGLAELGGFLRMLLEDYSALHADIKVVFVPPLTLKKFITGSGKGDKDLMMLHIYKNWKIECRDNNEGDAVALSLYGYEQEIGSAKKLKDLLIERLDPK